MSEVYLYDTETFAILFEFDADTKEARDGTATVSEKPSEAGADITDRVHRKPMKWTLEGIITAWPFGSPNNPLRVAGADSALEALADAGQPVGMATKWWAREVLITSDRASNAQGEGEALRFSIGVQTLNVPTPAYTNIPASRLKAKVRKRAVAAPTGGNAAGKTKPTETDWLYKLGGALGIG